MVLTSQARLGASDTPGGAWYSELAIPYYAFLEAGCAVRLYSIAGGPAPIDPVSRGEPWAGEETRRFDADPAAQEALAATGPVSALNPHDFDILFVPGGTATMWDLPGSAPLAALIAGAAQSPDKVVATLCHGACALVEVTDAQGQPLARARTLTSFTDSEERAVGADAIVPFLLETRLRALGAAFAGGPDWSDTVVRDGWLVTGQNPQSARRTATTALAAFAGRALAG